MVKKKKYNVELASILYCCVTQLALCNKQSGTHLNISVFN